jgi:PAS domain-containing protein
MEFFARELRQSDTALVASLAMLGSQIGQFAARRAAEREQVWNEARMRGVLEAALDCIITIDGTGRVLDFNPAAERTFGYAAADVRRRDIAELIVPPRCGPVTGAASPATSRRRSRRSSIAGSSLRRCVRTEVSSRLS